MSSSMSIQLAPKPGFCVKSSVIQPAAFSIRTQPVQVPAGLKVFVNVAWDKNVPSPPEGSEEDIRRAMQGQDLNEPNVHGWFVPVVVSEGRQDVDKAGKPALVFDCVYNSSIKTRSLADVEFKSFLVELALQRIEAQTGLALSRQIGTPNIASKGKLTPRTVHVPTRLFERLGGPAATAAGSTAGTTAESLSSPLNAPQLQSGSSGSTKSRPLIVDITPEEKKKPKTSFDGKLRGILKSGSSASSSAKMGTAQAQGSAQSAVVEDSSSSSSNSPLIWRWAKEGDKLRVTVAVPRLTRDLIEAATLDIEARRLILCVPGRPMLDINLDLSDAEIVARASLSAAAQQQPDSSKVSGTSSPSTSTTTSAATGKQHAAAVVSASAADVVQGASGVGGEQETQADAGVDELSSTLTLKRQRDFDVDGARAEWRVADRVLVVFV